MTSRPPRLLLAFALLVVGFALLPIVYLIIRAAGAGPEGWGLFGRPRVWGILRNSSLLAVTTTGVSVLLGVPLAWLTARTDLPLRRFWTVVSILPLALPSYIGAYALIALLGSRVYGFPGTALVISFINYPFVVLSVRAALQRMDPSLEEAAMGLGETRREVFRRVTLPQLRPAIGAGGLLVALYTLSDFGTPALMQFRTFTQVIYTRYRGTFDRESAALIALMLVALTIVVLVAESLTRGRARYHRSASGTQRPAPTVELGIWKWPAFAYCSTLATVSLGVPIGVIVYWGLVGLANDQPLNLPFALVSNSVAVALAAAAVAVVASFPVVFLAVRYRGRLVSALDRATYLGNALPGIVIALSLVFFSARLLSVDAFAWIYQSFPLLIFAYVVRFLPQSVGCIRTSLVQVPPKLEEAARGLGRSRISAFLSVTVPLLWPGILAGAALVFLTTIKELPVTLLLSPTGFETLVTEIWTNVSDARFSQASPPALLLIAVSGLSIMVILRQERRGQYG